ncbi:MAG: hypothetical protein WCZ23_06405 [Rhodospirillaceae bacterium]
MPTLLAALLPPILWMAFFLIVYVVEALGCRYALDGGVILALNGAVTVATVAAIVVIAGLAWVRTRRLPPETPGGWLAHLSLLLSGTTLVATLWVGLPLLVVPPCQ